jgi:hypothetical protein
MGAHHRRVWAWAEALTPGVKPPALLECWSRGHGKSTTAELVGARLVIRAARRFILYVSCTQDAANRHVGSVAAVLERAGVERSIGAYGHSKGWTQEVLRAANGCNVLAFGLDAGARGVKLNEVRPDLIILDDVDELGDSPEVARKRGETITQTVLRAGSTDCAIMFVQNKIHGQSVMTRVLEGELRILLDRVDAPVIPAVRNLVTEEYEDQGRAKWRIVGGEATWPGMPLPVCEQMINESGLTAFLIECQHDVTAGGLFFSVWKCSRTWEEETAHEIWSFPVPNYWDAFGGFDWGKAEKSAAAFLLGVEDDFAAATWIDELYVSGQSNDEIAQGIVATITRNGYKVENVVIWADPSIFPPKDPAKRVGRYIVEDFWKYGLKMWPANNDRVNGWSRTTELMTSASPVPKVREQAEGKRFKRNLRAFKDRCPVWCRMMARLVPDPNNPHDLFKKQEAHIADAGRYGIERTTASEEPETKEEGEDAKLMRPRWMQGKKK